MTRRSRAPASRAFASAHHIHKKEPAHRCREVEVAVGETAAVTPHGLAEAIHEGRP